MNDNPIFSVLMPSYNHERFVADAIESVLSQTFGDLELIIIDDASSDGSASIIRGFQQTDTRIRAFFHEKNQGIARTMNEAISLACGKYIALFSSDDLWIPEKLEMQKQVLDESPNLIVWSDGIIIDGEGKEKGMTFLDMHQAVNKRKSGDLFKELVLENYIFGCSAAMSRECLRGLRYDTSLRILNDYKLMVDLSSRYCFHFVEKPLAYYRIHKRNTIRSSDIDWQKERILVRKYFLEQYKDKLTSYERGYIYLSMSMSQRAIGNFKKALLDLLLSIRHDRKNLLKLIKLLICYSRRRYAIARRRDHSPHLEQL